MDFLMYRSDCIQILPSIYMNAWIISSRIFLPQNRRSKHVDPSIMPERLLIPTQHKVYKSKLSCYHASWNSYVPEECSVWHQIPIRCSCTWTSPKLITTFQHEFLLTENSPTFPNLHPYLWLALPSITSKARDIWKNFRTASYWKFPIEFEGIPPWRLLLDRIRRWRDW